MPNLPAPLAADLAALSKIHLEITGSFDLPFLKPIMDLAGEVRTTMDPEVRKRFDMLWAQICEDSYTVYRKAIVGLGLLEPLPPRS